MDNILLDAILSMDSYNRGYNAGIVFGTDPNNSEAVDGVTQIGNETVYQSANTADAQNIGFYAIAYQDDTTGDITISYRGTDEAITPIAKDVLFGYNVGAGVADTAQSEMAFQFYDTVAGQQAGTAISVTGHSLGGGLAGLVGATYGLSGILYDNMAFELAANNLATDRGLQTSLGPTLYLTAYDTGLVSDSPEFLNNVYGAASQSPSPEFSGLQTVAVAGEPLSLPFVPGDHAHQTGTPITLLDTGNVTASQLGDTFLNTVIDTSLHSASTLVLLEYADDPSAGTGVGTAWQAASQYFWPVLYDGTFAGNIGMSAVPGRYNTDPQDGSHDYATILRTVLAYSAINDGTRPFGDTGIVSLYHDADILGAVAGATGVSQTIVADAPDISKAFVEFAGELALHQILQSAHPGIIGGVLGFNGDGTLTVNFDPALWQTAGGGVAPSTIAHDTLVDDVLNSTGSVRTYATRCRICGPTVPTAPSTRSLLPPVTTGAVTPLSTIPPQRRPMPICSSAARGWTRSPAPTAMTFSMAARATMSCMAARARIFWMAAEEPTRRITRSLPMRSPSIPMRGRWPKGRVAQTGRTSFFPSSRSWATRMW